MILRCIQISLNWCQQPQSTRHCDQTGLRQIQPVPSEPHLHAPTNECSTLPNTPTSYSLTALITMLHTSMLTVEKTTRLNILRRKLITKRAYHHVALTSTGTATKHKHILTRRLFSLQCNLKRLPNKTTHKIFTASLKAINIPNLTRKFKTWKRRWKHFQQAEKTLLRDRISFDLQNIISICYILAFLYLYVFSILQLNHS